MPIPSARFNTVILLCEVDLNCKIIARSAAKLESAAKHWIDLAQGIDDGGSAPPIDIVTDCFACLSAAAAISRMLFLGKRAGKSSGRIKQRCEGLMQLLGNPQISALNSLSVRNSWEHLDERLDDLLESNTCRSHSEIHVSPVLPKPETFVSRHFDPTSMEIRFAGDKFALAPIVTESKLLSERVEVAFTKMSVSSDS
jgi:hypothetical protein